MRSPYEAGRAILLAYAFCAAPAARADLSAFAIVQGDGALRMSGYVVRLYGIYIPPTQQACYDFIRPPMCGPRAALALELKTSGNFVHCKERFVNADYSITASCSVGNEDLSLWMLQRGWAVALPDAPPHFAAHENIARARGIGIWGIPIDTRKQAPQRHCPHGSSAAGCR